MKIILHFGVLLLWSVSKGEVYKTKQPFIYQGQVYAALMNVNGNDTLQKGVQVISINFYILRPDKGNLKNFESFGGYFNVTRTFTLTPDNEYKLIPELSTTGNNGLCRFTRCNPHFSKDRVELLLTEYKEFNNFKLQLFKVGPGLPGMDQNDFISSTYLSEMHLQKATSFSDSNVSSKEAPIINFIPKYAGNIDSKEFSINQKLVSFLKGNNDFVFRVSKDLYLDILRFKANMFEYNEEKISTFLKTYDLWYIKYQDNPEMLDLKIKDCIALLKNASKLINLGEIYYKEFAVYPRDIDLNSCLFEYVSPTMKGEYSTKKIMGEEDAFYQANGLNIYLSNWASMKSLNLSEAQIHPYLAGYSGNPRPITFRVYFLLQPFPVFSDDGDFKGVTAYGIKSLLYNPCSTDPILSTDNNYIHKIADTMVKHCYESSINYLNQYFTKQGCNVNVHVAELYNDNFTELGSWRKPFPNCEVAYVYLAGKVKKVTPNEKVLCLRMMTNYKTTFQPGYKVTFSNVNSGKSYHLPFTEASIKLTGAKLGYYNLDIRIPTDVYNKLISSQINKITFQCLGEPEFLISHDFFYYNPNEEITTEIEAINTSFSINSDGDALKLAAFLRTGL